MDISIGSDESLKGDTFGGLTVAAVALNKEQEAQLEALGVKDSKKLSEVQIHALAAKINSTCLAQAVYSIPPEEYNKYSMTGLLNKYHKQVYQDIIKQLDLIDNTVTHFVDKYPGCNVGDVAEIKAESKYTSVAAASILARKAALTQMTQLSQKAGFTLPKGSTHVQEALQRMIESKKPLNEFVKLHFKNVRAALQS